jgi:hypothetical protein
MFKDGNWDIKLYHTTKVKYLFFGEVEVVDRTPYSEMTVAVKDDKVGDVALVGNPDIQMRFALPLVFNAEIVSLGDIVVGTRIDTEAGNPAFNK